MRRFRRLAITAAATAAIVAGALLSTPNSHADVPSPYFATSGKGSDPHMIRCTDPATGTNGYCLYTSVDMTQSDNLPDGCEAPGDDLNCANWYPMEQTKLYYSANGYSGWTDKGAVLHENTLEGAGWVPTNAFHLWAPAAIKDGSGYYLFVPDVTDVSDDAPPNIHTSSRVAVASATSPFGPYTYQGRVDGTGQYMSDPDVVIDGTSRILFWANGDYSTCGGFSAAQVESDWRTTVDRSIVPIDIAGIEVLGNCDPAGSAGPVGRPYMEGSSAYKSGNTWTMYFAVKPDDTAADDDGNDDVPKECRTAVGGTGSTNEAIAWATASSYTGTWTYKGIIMCGSTTEWTNQATIVTGTNNRKFIVYHDAGNGADYKQRNLHAECLFTNGSLIATVHSQAQNATNGFDACMAGTNADYWGLHLDDPQNALPPIIRAPSDGSALKADRYSVSPAERFKRETVSSGVYAYKALSNGKYLCAPDSATPVKATCTSTGNAGATWSFTNATGGIILRNRTVNKYLSVANNGQLYASASDDNNTAAIVNYLFAGGKSN